MRRREVQAGLAGMEEAVLDRGAPQDPKEIEGYLWHDVKPGSMGFDVGANMGQSTEKMLGLFTTVVAFEPAEESYEVLERDFLGKARLYRAAISDHTGHLKLAVREAPIMTGQLTAVRMPYRGEHMDAPGMAHWGAYLGERELPCMTLDMAMQAEGAPDFVKVDTEGHEGQVLRGAKAVMAEARPSWLIEFHAKQLYEECMELLTDAGYVPETVRHPYYPPKTHMWYRHGWIKASGGR